MNNIRPPVMVSQGPIIRIDYARKDPPGALLNAAKTALAVVQVFRLVHGAAMFIIVFEDAVDAFFLNTLFAAPGAIFPEFNRGILADGMKPWWRCFYGYMVFLGHELLHYLLSIIGIR
jgi:hypothetical protein